MKIESKQRRGEKKSLEAKWNSLNQTKNSFAENKTHESERKKKVSSSMARKTDVLFETKKNK
jgi:hypothetical protein